VEIRALRAEDGVGVELPTAQVAEGSHASGLQRGAPVRAALQSGSTFLGGSPLGSGATRDSAPSLAQHVGRYLASIEQLATIESSAPVAAAAPIG
jgi:hypothetical protein